MPLSDIFRKISDIVWGYPVLFLMLSAGVFLTIKLRFPQLHPAAIFRAAFGTADGSQKENAGKSDGSGLSRIQAFSTSLAATAGTGSIVGVAAALAAGGKGAVFWLWVSAFFGMALSFAENALGVKYCRDSKAKGAMAYIEKGLDAKWLAVLFAFFCVLASFGMGCMAQSNCIAAACWGTFSIPEYASAAVILISAAAVTSKNSRLAAFTERLMPALTLFYIVGTLYIIIRNIGRLPDAFAEIIRSAFTVRSAAGGFGGYILMSVITGLKRGAFSNEAGLGSTVAVHSSCRIKDPVVMGRLGMAEVFADTMVICTLTAFALILSGADLSGGGTEAVCAAFSQGGLGSCGEGFAALSLILFAFATIAGWYFIGMRAWEYVRPHGGKWYRPIFLICAFCGAAWSPSLVWELSDIFNGLMAIPNLMAVLALSGEAAKLVRTEHSEKNTRTG